MGFWQIKTKEWDEKRLSDLLEANKYNEEGANKSRFIKHLVKKEHDLLNNNG